MRFLGPAEVAAALPWAELIESIAAAATADDIEAPSRTLHRLPGSRGADNVMLMKPAWRVGRLTVVKVATVVPDNGERNLPLVHAGVLLFDGVDGRFLGACDGNELTVRRTAAASALASSRLARPTSARLLVVGTGAVAGASVEAHAAIRPIETVEVWGRRSGKAAELVGGLTGWADSTGTDIVVAGDLREAVGRADIVSCATGSPEALVLGDDVRPGTHIDLVGAFDATMRESDDALIARAEVWVDTVDDALLAGDLAHPIAAGSFSADQVMGDLAALASASGIVRSSDDAVTVFKSVGTALEDLAAAELVFDG